MTQHEYNEIITALETVGTNENRLCDEYIKLNPQEDKRRRRDRDLVLYGLMRAHFEIERRFKNSLSKDV